LDPGQRVIPERINHLQSGMPCGSRFGPVPAPGRLGVILAVSGCLLAGTHVRAQGVDFPGPAIVDLDTTTISCSRVTGFADADRYLVIGTADGFLDLAQFRVQTGTIGLLNRFEAGGLAMDLIPDPLRLGAGGLVAAMANPDRLDFLTVQPTLPYFMVEESHDLPEDPGRVREVDLGVTADPGLVVSLPGLDRVVVLGHGSGQWSIRQEVPVGDGPGSVGVGDLDGDGLEEIYLSQSGFLSRDVGVLVQDGSGHFHLETTLDLGTPPGPLAVFDIDGAAPVELVVGAAEQPAAHVFTFTSGSYLDRDQIVLDLPVDALKLDHLLDGRTALLTGNMARGVVEMQVLSSGVWSPAGAYYSGCRPVDFLLHDLSGDGRFDVTCVGEAPGITVLYGDPSRLFWTYPVSVLQGDPLGLSLIDTDGGGRPDAVVVSSLSSRIDLFPALIDGVFAVLPTSMDLGFPPGQMVGLGELVSGGEPVAVSDPVGSRIITFDLSRNGVLNALDTIASGGGIRQLLAADMDGDGHGDLVYLKNGLSEVNLVFGLGEGRFADPLVFPTMAVPTAATSLDLDGDDDRELVFVDGLSQSWWMENTNGRNFGNTTSIPAGSRPALLTVGDFDGDLDEDLVVANNGERTLSFFENDGAGHLVARLSGYSLDGAVSSLEVADVSDDGRQDILANQRELGATAVVIPQAGFSGATTFSYAFGPDIATLATGLFNDDNRGDILALDGEFRLGMTLLNGFRNLVAVTPQALEFSCSTAGPRLIVSPDRPGSWSLAGALVRDGNVVWSGLAGPGWSVDGDMAYDRGRWLWDPDPGFPATSVAGTPTAPFRLRLTLGTGGDAETLEKVWDDPCGKTAPVAGAPALAWSGLPRPNPFNPVLQFSLDVKRPGQVAVGVYDVRGRLVHELYRAVTPVGRLDLTWRGETAQGPAPSGVYVIHGATEGARLSAKVVLAR